MNDNTRQIITDALDAIRSENPENCDDFTQWAVEVMPDMQDLIDDLGLHGYQVVGSYPNDHWLDEIVVRTPWGEEHDVPTHGLEEDADAEAIDGTISFFLDLAQRHEQDALAVAISDAVRKRMAIRTQ